MRIQRLQTSGVACKSGRFMLQGTSDPHPGPLPEGEGDLLEQIETELQVILSGMRFCEAAGVLAGGDVLPVAFGDALDLHALRIDSELVAGHRSPGAVELDGGLVFCRALEIECPLVNRVEIHRSPPVAGADLVSQNAGGGLGVLDGGQGVLQAEGHSADAQAGGAVQGEADTLEPRAGDSLLAGAAESGDIAIAAVRSHGGKVEPPLSAGA
ncbi:hypothetical protein CMI47_20865 [Candidatus Pacearchaeota archaeon]|nr:hypothetical protein [Candidatus Pacearchaeota archaeon]